MMTKKVKAVIKLQIQAGKATPAPPIGPALGQHGVNIMEFCKKYNEITKDKDGIIPAEITIFEDRTFSFVCKTPPASYLLRQAAGIEKGSAVPNKTKVGKISFAKLEEIAKIKMPDLGANTLAAASRMLEGTAKNMGIEIIN